MVYTGSAADVSRPPTFRTAEKIYLHNRLALHSVLAVQLVSPGIVPNHLVGTNPHSAGQHIPLENQMSRCKDVLVSIGNCILVGTSFDPRMLKRYKCQ